MFARFLFALLAVCVVAAYGTASLWMTLGISAAIAAALFGVEQLFKRFSLRALTTTLLGLFVGCLVGQALLLFSSTALGLFEVRAEVADLVQLSLFFTGAYLGTLMTVKASEEWALSIPFIRLERKMAAPIADPCMQAGEAMRIKIQRYGKEPHQGVGYLEDGTMVVINGGGPFLGELIDARVLSVKQTSAGRMIFCNLKEGLPGYGE